MTLSILRVYMFINYYYFKSHDTIFWASIGLPEMDEKDKF